MIGTKVRGPYTLGIVSEVHGLYTRSKDQLFIPNTNLTSVQKGITCSGIKIYNSLPSNILSLKNDRKRLINELHWYLLVTRFTLSNNSWSLVDKLFACNLYCIVIINLCTLLILETVNLTLFIILCRVVSSCVLCIFCQVSCPTVYDRIRGPAKLYACMYMYV
jgi:hypothetical protein